MSSPFWTSSEPQFKARACRLLWTRKADGQASGEAEVERIPQAVWRQRDGVHYLTYTESAVSSEGDTRTTLRIERDVLTWIRHGLVTWTHSFREGEAHSSRMMLTQQWINVETRTKSLQIEVRENSGVISIAYDFAMDDEWDVVDLGLHFEVTPGSPDGSSYQRVISRPTS